MNTRNANRLGWWLRANPSAFASVCRRVKSELLPCSFLSYGHFYRFTKILNDLQHHRWPYQLGHWSPYPWNATTPYAIRCEADDGKP